MNPTVITASAVVGLSLILAMVYKKSIIDKKINELNNCSRNL